MNEPNLTGCISTNPNEIYDGNIDRIERGVVYGWIKKIGENEPVIIDAIVNNEIVAEKVSARLHRVDVKEAGYGTGNHGFEFLLPELYCTEICVEIRVSKSHNIFQKKVMFLNPNSSMDDPREVFFDDINVPKLHFEGDARIEHLSNNHLRGWAVNRNDPSDIFDIEILIDGFKYCTVKNDQSRKDLLHAGRSGGQGGISQIVPFDLLDPSEHVVSIRLPDGIVIDKKISTEYNSKIKRFNSLDLCFDLNSVAIIVPIYNAAEDLKICIDRLLEFTHSSVEILLIDDCSSDSDIADIIADAVSNNDNIRALRNAKNMGFTKTVNIGLADIGRKNAILLNSDARVTPGWLEGMLRAAASRPRVATVTPMSDRAGAFSAPKTGNSNALPPGVDEVTYARAFRRRGLGLYPIVPTGNGFCMFVSRGCLDEVGGLDDEAFPRGYGEENDFCMRAGRVGWTHLVDDRTYVFHERSKSFGDAKHSLLDAGRAVVDERYPEYQKAIGIFGSSPKMRLARLRGALAANDCARPQAGLSRFLFVVATQTGGTPQTNLDLMAALADGAESWLLRCDSTELVLSHFQPSGLREVRRHTLGEALEPIRHVSAEYDQVVADWLEELDIDLVHIRHIAWHSINLPRVAQARGCRVVFSFHDFYTLCPTVKMLRPRQDDPEGGRPGATLTPELWPEDSMPPLSDRWEAFWRSRFGRALSVCDAFVTTSDSARSTVLAYLPGIDPDRFHVIPHGRDFTDFKRLRRRPRHGAPLRILVPGNIGMAKGLGVIRDLLAIDQAGLLEFHVLGTVNQNEDISHPRLVLHGGYARKDFARRVEQLDVHFGAVFSVWNETFCHTLTELWSVGVPAFVFEFPTVAGRVRASGAGWVLPHEDIASLYERLVEIAFDSREQDRVEAALAAWQEGAGVGQSTRWMAARYLNVYREAQGLKPLPLIAVVAKAESSLDRANASTEVRIWERTRPGQERQAIYVRMTPQALLANLRDETVARLLCGAVLQRDAIPATMIDHLLAAFEEAGIRYLLDLDDDLLNVPEDKDPTGSYAAYAPRLKQLIRAATIVTVSTEPLRSRLAALNSRVMLLTNCLSEPLWRGPQPERVADGMLRALYFGGFTHGADLAMVMPALEAIATHHPDFRLRVVGVQRENLPPWVEHIEVPTESKTYARFVPWLRAQATHCDFAIAPLLDTPFNRCKSGLKVLEVLALGLPVIASDLPMYRDICGDFHAAAVVPEELEAWVAALDAAIIRAKSGGANADAIRQAVLESYGMKSGAATLDALVVELSKFPRTK